MFKSVKCIIKCTFWVMISSMMLSNSLLAFTTNNNDKINQVEEEAEQRAAQMEMSE